MYCTGEGFGIQLTHDPVWHSEDEGISGRSRDVTGLDVSNRQGLPDITWPTVDMVTEHGY